MQTKSVKRPTLLLLLYCVAGGLLYYAMLRIQPRLPHIIFDYAAWDGNRGGNILWRIMWLLGDPSEPHFHKTILGGLGMTTGSWFAYWLYKRRSPLCLTPIGYGKGKLWTGVFWASTLSLIIAGILFGGLHVDNDQYVSTYVCYVSVAGAIILSYGYSASSVVTGAVLGALTTVPVAIWMRNVVCLPNELPGGIATVCGMWIGGIISFEVCEHLPYMKSEKLRKTLQETNDSNINVDDSYKYSCPNKFFFRRILCDFSEPVFAANEWASVFLIIGSMLTWFLNPDQPFYGNKMFPALIFCEILTTGFAMWFYWNEWMERDFVPTFVPLVSVAPACIMQYGDSLFVIIFASVTGALIAPAVADAFNERKPALWHNMIGFTFSMAATTWLVVVILRFLLMI